MTTGQRFTIDYPFVQEGYIDWQTGAADSYWRPGTYEDESDRLADGMGRCVYTVVDTFKPGDYPTRVFYLRDYVDPDGEPFGSGSHLLRVHSLGHFRRLIRGYRLPYKLSDFS